MLAGIDYNDERKLGDAQQPRRRCSRRLVQHFSKLSLRNANLSEPDMLGRAYEYLIEKFADDAGKKGGEFYTPRMVVQLMVELLAPKEGMRICDPTVRLGRHADRVRALPGAARAEPAEPVALRAGEEPRHVGHLQDEHAAARAAGSRGSRRATRSATRSCVEGGALMLFDRVIANPPFSPGRMGPRSRRARRLRPLPLRRPAEDARATSRSCST